MHDVERERGVATKQGIEQGSDLLRTIEQQDADIASLNARLEQVSRQKDGWKQRVREQRGKISAMKQASLRERLIVENSDVNWLRKAASVLILGYPKSWKTRLLALMPGYFSSKRQKALLKRKGLFDEALYKAKYEDVAESPIDPLYHYLNAGMGEGRTRGDKPAPAPARAPAEGLTADLIRVDIGPTAPPHGMRIAIHAHMFYAELTQEFADYFARMPCEFDIYASTPNEEAGRAVENTFSAIANASLVDVRVVPNRGRDIAPFLVEFASELAEYDVVAHVHTKKSLYNNGSTDGWREYVLGTLLPSANDLSQMLRLLDDEKYGLIYPQCFTNLPYMANTWLSNIGLAHAWGPHFGLRTLPEGYFDFPVGSMFWARTEAIRPLLEAGLDWNDFPPEQGQTDATLAHCIERMLGAVPASNGFRHGVIRDERTPSWSRWRLDQFFARPVDHLLGAVKSPDIPVVAFDIFDTLITRPFLNPDYVKALLHDDHGAAGIDDFLNCRTRGEVVARSRNGKDVDIHEIYRHVEIGVESTGIALTPDREIALEIASVRPRKEVIALLSAAVESGKRVILASDMFLPREVIATMLEKCGVSGWHKLYLSSEIGFRKDTGELYEHILSEEGVASNQILMIGDNERSDFQIPCDMKFHVAHLLKPTSILRALPRMERIVPDPHLASLDDQFLFGAIAAENCSPISYPDFSPDDMFGSSARSIGFGLLGPIALCFSQWVLEQARKEGLDQLFFLAREGQFLKEAFDRWQVGEPEPVESKYLYISRRAVTVPCIGSISDIFAIAETNNFYTAEMATFLAERFGTVLNDETWAECEQAGLWRRDAPLTIIDGEIDQIRPFLRFIAPEILKVAAAERENALKYLRGAGLGSGGRAAVIDIGYGATIQKHMMKLLDCGIDGLYMMTHVRAKSVAAERSVIVNGCFADAVGKHNPMPRMYEQSFLLEKMLSSNDEQVIRYSVSGHPKFRDPQAATAAAVEVRKQMQEGAIAFVEEAVRFSDGMGRTPVIGQDRCHQLYSAFVERLSEGEKDVFRALALDDFYCGRGFVTE